MNFQKLILPSFWILQNMTFLHAAVDPIHTNEDHRAPSVIKEGKTRSTEWKLLPTQNWEYSKIEVKPSKVNKNIDSNFFDLTSVAVPKLAIHINPSYFISARKIDPMGTIVGSRTERKNLTNGDMVSIRASDALQVGESYAIFEEEPLQLRKEYSRRGFIYPILGIVKVTGVQENLFVGTITETKKPLKRNTFITLAPRKALFPTLLPGPQSVRGTVMLDPSESSTFLAQHKEVFIDRGSEDGVQPGMIFRIFQTKDPVTLKEFSRSGLAIAADIVITQVTDNLSTASVFRSNTLLKEGAEAMLLTDLSDLNTKKGFGGKGGDALEELEKIDNRNQLSTKDKKVLDQLEQWKTPSGKDPSLNSATAKDTQSAYVLPPAPPEKQQADAPLPVGSTNESSTEDEANVDPPSPPSDTAQAPAAVPTPPPPVGAANGATVPPVPGAKKDLALPPPMGAVNEPQLAPPAPEGNSTASPVPLTEAQPPQTPVIIPMEAPPTAPGTQPQPPTPSAKQTPSGMAPGAPPRGPEETEALPDLPAPPNS